MDDDNIYALIDEISSRVREVLYNNSNAEWFDCVASYYSDNSEFPSNVDIEINEKFSKLIKEDPSLSKVRDDYKSILNSGDEDCAEQLRLQIFFPPDELGELRVETCNEEEECEFMSDDEEIAPEELKTVITLRDLEMMQDAVVAEIASALSIHLEVAEVLLKEFDFKKDLLYSSYSGDGRVILRRIGLSHKQAMKPIHLKKVKNPADCCNICFMDDVKLYALPCGHAFCFDCWKSHIITLINNGNFEIPCMMQDCKCQVVMRDVIKICGENISLSYSNFILEHQIAIDGGYMHCLRPGCPNVLTLDCVGLCHVATCTCGMRLCWKCKEEAHAPLSCDLVKSWRKITDEEGLEAKWLVENTKPCPKCHERIEKNGGCNHMTCRKESGGCGYEFCWICGHEWNSHKGDGYSCNKFTNFDTIKLKDGFEKVDLKRLDHFYTRYTSHKKSKENEAKSRERAQSILISSFETNKKTSERLPTEEALLLSSEVFQAIDTARSVLIWSYPHAFYMKPNSTELRLFEHVQTEVERYLEQITDMVENQSYLPATQFKKMKNILSFNTEVLNKHVDSYSK